MLDVYTRTRVFLRERGMWHVIYVETFEGPVAVPFSTGMQDHIMQLAPLACCGIWVPILSPLVGRTIQAATQAVAHLGQIEPDRQNQEA